ncbi:hypothetical protein MBM_09739 [Drepanopeziza brunnea f. sp. 'multigermtubi' MB_m1]|uniref:DDE-1 domain-containing protein n=1 Tax=Marssonina brunnea f. sp. multigermtubi (strain MB_m1) TaxID=1072389 RepID=K1WIV8_MARBU|nr:uncharacterized protein MBM_09739 [Drepanopeziza brunnea f. sp. 'multigermtubi' MB_m1]EKD12102.1 hypothetical protein MBM_09739 [Drepanopeziza brunnea f. sp. 'multigermtubi' MB_m1]
MGRKRTRSKKPSRIFQYKSHAQPGSPNAIEDLATLTSSDRKIASAAKTSGLYKIKTKPLARIRISAQDTNAVHKWFKSYRRTLKKMNIRLKDIINFDETGFRIGCPRRTEVLVPGSIQEFYSVSLKNRRSVTIIEMINATSQKPIPLMILIQSKRLMQQWFVSNLLTSTLIKEADNGFTDNKIALLYLEHYIKNADCGPNKPWKLMLMDNHASHRTPEFINLANKNHILPYPLIPYLTHCMQPLDVRIFQPYKHYYDLAIKAALTQLDVEYTINSFLNDLDYIRNQTLSRYNIKKA